MSKAEQILNMEIVHEPSRTEFSPRMYYINGTAFYQTRFRMRSHDVYKIQVKEITQFVKQNQKLFRRT